MLAYLDFSLADFGTVWLLTPITAAADRWASDNFPANAIRWGGGIAIDRQLLDDVIDAIGAAGLCVEGTAARGQPDRARRSDQTASSFREAAAERKARA